MTKQAILTTDLGFGDAGKGAITDYLTRQHNAHTVVRFNGGAQAGHRVVSDMGEHVFSQFGSGTLAGARTHLSRFMLIEPLAMLAEAAHLQELGIADPFGLTTIDERALVTTPFQRAVNRLKELARGDGRHGSCGMGIGETMVDWLAHGGDVLFSADFSSPTQLKTKLHHLQTLNQAKAAPLHDKLPETPQAKREWECLHDPNAVDRILIAYEPFIELAHVVPGDYLHLLLERDGTIIFEPAQGVLLDEWYGFHPYTTWSTTTLANAETLLHEASYDGNVQRIGITRAYTPRHGAGPLPSEDAQLTAMLPDARNGFDAWQEGFRVGWLDLELLRYALDVVGNLDGLAVTCLDRVAQLPEIKVCVGHDGRKIERWHGEVGIFDERSILRHQSRQTEKLLRNRPILQSVANPQELLNLLEQETGYNVLIQSWSERCKQPEQKEAL